MKKTNQNRLRKNTANGLANYAIVIAAFALTQV